ncbi:hypothetical protein V1291_000043 [Nitrobacteraceae bacterium AZCC 1564]
MDHRLIEGLMEGIAPLIRGYVDEQVAKATEPLVKRLAEVEARPQLKGEPGKDADPAFIEQLVTGAVAKIPPAAPGKDADPAVIAEMVAAAVAEIPPAAPGKSVTVEDVAPLIAEEVERAVSAIVASIDVAPIVDAAISKAVAALPPAKDGQSVTADDVRPMLEALVDDAVKAIPAPKDGVGVAGAFIDRDDALVLTLSDGSTKSLGVVVGKDADMSEIDRIISEKVAAIPVPRDGADGLGFEDMTEELADDGRTIVRRYVCGDQVKEFRHTFAVVLDRGIYGESKDYSPGDGVTFGGSFWIKRGSEQGKPGEGDAWRLAVKRGRDGKDFAPEAKSQTTPIKLR